MLMQHTQAHTGVSAHRGQLALRGGRTCHSVVMTQINEQTKRSEDPKQAWTMQRGVSSSSRRAQWNITLQWKHMRNKIPVCRKKVGLQQGCPGQIMGTCWVACAGVIHPTAHQHLLTQGEVWHEGGLSPQGPNRIGWRCRNLRPCASTFGHPPPALTPNPVLALLVILHQPLTLHLTLSPKLQPKSLCIAACPEALCLRFWSFCSNDTHLHRVDELLIQGCDKGAEAGYSACLPKAPPLWALQLPLHTAARQAGAPALCSTPSSCLCEKEFQRLS